MTAAATLQLENVEKRLGDFSLRIDGLTVRPGETLALLGPTGAGKSTLLRLLAGLIPADAGRLSFNDEPLVADQLSLATRRRLTMVPQQPLLLSGSVRFNVAYGLRLRKRRDAEPCAEEWLKRLRLVSIADQSAATLSGGQSQLVALARALATAPDLLLLDEPTSHLDPAHVALVERTMRTLQRDRITTVVWATHNLFQAKRVATRTGLLLNGRLVEEAATEAFYSRPSDPRTADFVAGRMVY